MPEARKTGPNIEYFLLAGLVAGLILPLLTGAGNLRALILTTQLPGNGLIMFSERPGVNVQLESDDRKLYMLGQTSKKGVLFIKDLTPGLYQLRFSLPDTRTILQKIKVAAGLSTVVAFENRVKLPKSNLRE